MSGPAILIPFILNGTLSPQQADRVWSRLRYEVEPASPSGMYAQLMTEVNREIAFPGPRGHERIRPIGDAIQTADHFGVDGQDTRP